MAHFSGNRGPLFRVGWARNFFSLYLVAKRGPLVAQSPASKVIILEYSILRQSDARIVCVHSVGIADDIDSDSY